MKVRYFEKYAGQWWLDFRVHVGGVAIRKRVPSGQPTQELAEREAPAIIASVMNAAMGNSPKAAALPVERPLAGVTLQQAYDKGLLEREQWLEAKDKDGIEDRYMAVAAYWGADTDLSACTREAVLKWRAVMMDSPGKRPGTKMKASTINQRLSMLTVLLSLCDLPPHTVKQLSTEKDRRKRRTREDELQAMHGWLSSHAEDRKGALTMSDLMTVALHTTARQSELLELKWADVYLDRAMVMFRDPKNGTSRESALSDVAMRILERRRGYALAGPFSNITQDQCTRLWSQGRKAIGLEHDEEFVFHVATRHEGLSRAGETGTSTFMIKALGGHKSTQSSDGYVKPSSGSTRALVEAIANYNPTN